MEIEHKLDGTQVEYGYIWWKKNEVDKYRRIFPDIEFTIDLGDKKVERKKVDWSMRRVYVGKNEMQAAFQKDDIIIIARTSPHLLTLRKKGGVTRPTPIELPLAEKLRTSQRNSENPSAFEQALRDAFTTLGLDTKHIGGRDEPDILVCFGDINIVIDSKTTKDGVITERYVNFDAMLRYTEKYSAKHTAVIAPGFSEGYVRDTAAKRGTVLIETEALCKVLENHKVYPYEPENIVEMLFNSGKTVVGVSEILPSTKDHQKLIDTIARIIKVLKNFEKNNIVSFNTEEIRFALVGQGCAYQIEEVQQALSFLSTPPFSFLRSGEDKYTMCRNIGIMMNKIGLFFKAYSTME